MQSSSPVPKTLESGLRLILVHLSSIWDEPGYRPAVARDHDLFSLFHAVKQTPEGIFRFKGANLV